MKAIVITEYGGPEKLEIRDLPEPQLGSSDVLIEVKAFGLNRAETYMRRGEWPEIAAVSGIECAGLVAQDLSGGLARGTTVVALMGGMGRTRNGSYAQYVVASHLKMLSQSKQRWIGVPLPPSPSHTRRHGALCT